MVMTANSTGTPYDGNSLEFICRVFSDEVNQSTAVSYAYILLSVVNGVLSIITSLGNILILLALQKVSSLHPPTKLLFRSLAFASLSAGLITQPTMALYFTSIVNQNWRMCKGISWIGVYFGTSLCAISIVTLGCISVDRFLAVSLGLRYRQIVTVLRVRVVVCIVWLFFIAVSVGNNLWKPTLSLYLTLYCIIIALTIGISSFCYLKIYLVLRIQQSRVLDQHYQHQTMGNTFPNVRHIKKTMSAVILSQVTLIACFLPMSVGLLGSVQTSNFTCAEPNTSLGRPK